MKVGYQVLADLQQQQAFKQWGFANNTGRPYITFPFKFSNVFTAISCICHNGSPSEANTVYNVSISGMNIGASGGGSGKYWCAFGVAQQQWGYYVESQNPTDYRYWSIPFTSHYITMATKTYYEPKEEAVPWLVGIDMQKFICGYGANFIGSSYVSCVGIGCQPQWGYSTVGSGAWALKFNGVYTAVVVGAPGFPAREFCGFTFDYTLTGWSFTAGYNSPISYIRPTTTAISLGY